MKMELYTTITDLEFSMGFANLFTTLLVQRFLVFPSRRFVEGFYAFMADFYHLLIFAFKNVVGFITYPFTAQGEILSICFLGITTSFNR